jgi:hypothetical protein
VRPPSSNSLCRNGLESHSCEPHRNLPTIIYKNFKKLAKH